MKTINIHYKMLLGPTMIDHNEVYRDEYKEWLVRNDLTARNHFEHTDEIMNPLKVNITRQIRIYNRALKNKSFNLISWIIKLTKLWKR